MLDFKYLSKFIKLTVSQISMKFLSKLGEWGQSFRWNESSKMIPRLFERDHVKIGNFWILSRVRYTDARTRPSTKEIYLHNDLR